MAVITRIAFPASEARPSSAPSQKDSKAEVPTTDQLLKELDVLVTAGKQIKGKGTIHVRIEKSGRTVFEKTATFLE